jgi:hypothetical protein
MIRRQICSASEAEQYDMMDEQVSSSLFKRNDLMNGMAGERSKDGQSTYPGDR